MIDDRNRWARRVPLLQGLYYAVSGLWPLLHMPSFLAVTGPKTDLWLVQTVGALITVIGAALFWAGLRGRTNLETRLLAMGSAAALAFVDFYFSLNGRIWAVYMLDGFAEAALLVIWLLVPWTDKPNPRNESPLT